MKVTECISCGLEIFANNEDVACERCTESEKLKKMIERIKREAEQLERENKLSRFLVNKSADEEVIYMSEITWTEARENNDGIKTLAYQTLNPKTDLYRIVGYNGILKGDKVIYQKKEYTVVMVSRLGHFGLSDTGELPYTICASPSDVEKI